MPAIQMASQTSHDAGEYHNGLPNGIEIKFFRLREEWKAQRQHESSTLRMAMLPAYQTIIGMGSPVVPLLLRELEQNCDLWFWALHAITEADPVPSSQLGNVKAMAQAWLAWGREQGYQW